MIDRLDEYINLAKKNEKIKLKDLNLDELMDKFTHMNEEERIDLYSRLDVDMVSRLKKMEEGGLI